jgi:hypothetical protein
MNDKFDELAKDMAQFVREHGLKKFGVALAGVVLAGTASLADSFTKITVGPVVDEIEYSWPCAWGDFDNDGFIDLLVGNSYEARNSLFRNNGDGTFSKVTAPQVGGIVTDIVNCHGTAWGDFNNDGFLDLVVSQTTGKLRLYMNNGNGSFTTLSLGESGLVTHRAATHGVAWGDFDNDGLLDLAVAHHGPNGHNWLFRNTGDGFRQVGNSAIAKDPEDWDSVCWGDYDNDGRLDLLAICFGGNNILYHNEGDGTFAKRTDSVRGVDFANHTGGSWGDYDNDGWLDLCIGRDDGPNLLFHNNRDGTFTRVTDGPIATEDHGRGCIWGDYDNDGWLDLFINRGSPFGSNGPGESNALYHNNGDGTFTRITEGSIVNDVGQGQGCAWGDYDNDGFVDLFVANGGFAVGIHKQANFLYRNNGNANNWITLKLVGTVSNRGAIGAKVRVRAVIGGRALWQLREISGGSNGQECQSDMRPSFGLGDATFAETIRIEWPSGRIQELHNVAAKQFLTIVEL